MHISVIIPFRSAGDASVLRWTLEGYASQNLSAEHSFDILLGLDGEPASILPPLQFNKALALTIRTFPQIGAAAVRNALIRQTTDRTDLLVFGNADTRPAPDMLQKHAQTIASLPPGSMVLGSAPWDTPPEPTVFDAFLARTPVIFFYATMQPRSWFDFRWCWTLNLSMRRTEFLACGGFCDEIRPVYYEDLALGLRHMEARRGIWYEPAISVTHRHFMTLEQYLDREEFLGIMAPVFARHCPRGFNILFGTDLARIIRYIRPWTQLDISSHRNAYLQFREWASSPVSDLGSGPARDRLLNTLYHAHMPFKRYAFRVGLLRGLELVDDARWMDRKPQGLWRKFLQP